MEDKYDVTVQLGVHEYIVRGVFASSPSHAEAIVKDKILLKALKVKVKFEDFGKPHFVGGDKRILDQLKDILGV